MEDASASDGGLNSSMKYLIAWLLGVPGILVIAWFLLSHH
jgi:hypothetical protein